MSVVHTSRLRIAKHEGPHRTAHLEGFAEPIHFGIHGGIKQFYKEKYGREIHRPGVPGHAGSYHRRGRGLTDRHPGSRTGCAGNQIGR
jgi:hypothetical protein